jgi:hypothetical protein
VENFGLAKSPATNVRLGVRAAGKEPANFTASLSALEPYEANTVKFRVPADLTPGNSTSKVEIALGDETQEEALKVDLKLP